jgi:hypothetical protein
VSKRVSAVPSRKKTAYMSGRPARSSSAATPRKPTARKASTAAIKRRLSSRSTRVPLGRANRSHGRRWAKARPAISSGSRVRAAASRGPATSVIPSPRLERVLEAKSFAYSLPRSPKKLTPRPFSPVDQSAHAPVHRRVCPGRHAAHLALRRQGLRRGDGTKVPWLGRTSCSLSTLAGEAGPRARRSHIGRNGCAV